MSEWVECTLGEAPIQIIDGDRGKNYPKKTEFLDVGYCLFLNAKNVTSTGFAFSDLNFIDQERDALLRKGKLKRGDLVLTTRGTVGNVAYYSENVPYDHIRINSGMVIIRSDGIHERFNYQLFKSLSSSFQVFATGSAQPQLPIRDLREIPILLPPLGEQEAIAAVLSSLDDKIDLLHRQNNTLVALAQTLFRHWFIDGAEPNWMDKFGNLPIDIIDGDRGRNYPKNTEFSSDGYCLFLSAKNVTKDGFSFDNCSFITKEKDEILRSGKLNRQDIVLTTRGTVGNSALYHELINYDHIRINSGMVIFRSASEDFPSLYLYILLNSIYFSRLVAQHMSGSAQPQLPIRDIRNIEIIAPSKEAVDRFMEVAVPIYDKVHMNKSQIHTLENLRDTVSPKLMSGSVRVKLSI